MRLIFYLSILISSLYLFSCKKDEHSDQPEAESNAPYLLEAPIFTIVNHGYSADSTSGCGIIVSIYDSAFENITGYYHVDNIPEGIVPQSFESYSGMMKVYPDKKHTCKQTWLEPSHELTLSKCDILYMKLYQ